MIVLLTARQIFPLHGNTKLTAARHNSMLFWEPITKIILNDCQFWCQHAYDLMHLQGLPCNFSEASFQQDSETLQDKVPAFLFL